MIFRFFYFIRGEIFLIVLIFLSTLLLQSLNIRYQKAIALREKAFRMELLTDFKISFSENEMDTIFSRRILRKKISGNEIYIDTGGRRYAAVKGTDSGLWGPVTLFLVLDMKTRHIKKLSVISHTETPGLGARMEEAWFLDQFVGLDVSNNIRVGISRKRSEVTVDAITGATVTSLAVESIVNKGVHAAKDVLKTLNPKRKKKKKVKKKTDIKRKKQ